MKKRKLGNEISVGIFFILCIVGLIYMTLSTGKVHVSREGYHVYVVFDDVSGLQKNSPVMINGLEVGRVQELTVLNQDGAAKIIIKLLVKHGTQIWSNPSITIKTLGLMGEKFVHIKSSGSGELVEPGATLTGKSPGDMDALFSEAEVIVKNVNDLALEVKKLTINLNEAVTENRKYLVNSMSNIEEITGKLKLTLQSNEGSLDAIIRNLDSTTGNLNELSNDLKRNPWKLFFRSKEKKKSSSEKKGE